MSEIEQPKPPKPISFRCPFYWGQSLYFATDPKQKPWQLTGVTLTPNGPIYILSRHGFEDLEAFECELLEEQDMLMKTTEGYEGDDD